MQASSHACIKCKCHKPLGLQCAIHGAPCRAEEGALANSLVGCCCGPRCQQLCCEQLGEQQFVSCPASLVMLWRCCLDLSPGHGCTAGLGAAAKDNPASRLLSWALPQPLGRGTAASTRLQHEAAALEHPAQPHECTTSQFIPVRVLGQSTSTNTPGVLCCIITPKLL